MKNICNIKIIQQKHTTKMNPSNRQSVSVKLTKIDNVISDNGEDFPWPNGTICIAGDSIVSGLQTGLLSEKRKVKVTRFSGANVRDMHNNIKPILRHKSEYMILHVSTNKSSIK